MLRSMVRTYESQKHAERAQCYIHYDMGLFRHRDGEDRLVEANSIYLP